MNETTDSEVVHTCAQFNASNYSTSQAITTSCALFDFAIYTVAMGLLAALGVLGNVVSFAVLLRDRGRSATSFLLQALAVADTLVLLTAVPLYVTPPVYPFTGLLAGYYATYMSLLPVLWPLYLMPYTFTVMVTVLVSMHRYCAVCKPTVMACTRVGMPSTAAAAAAGRSSSVFCSSNAPQARRKVAVLALFSVIYNIPRFLEYETVTQCLGVNETHDVFQVSEFGSNRLYRIIYANVLYFVVIHGGPLLLIAFFNVNLIQALKRRQRRWAEMGKNWYQQDISVVLVVVMCVFIVCQTPTFVDHILWIYLCRITSTSSDHILWTFVDKEARTCGNWHYYYTAVGDLLVICNSSVNFVIYILTSRNFRHALVLLQAGMSTPTTTQTRTPTATLVADGAVVRRNATTPVITQRRGELMLLNRDNNMAVTNNAAPGVSGQTSRKLRHGAAMSARCSPRTNVKFIAKSPDAGYLEPRVLLH